MKKDDERVIINGVVTPEAIKANKEFAAKHKLYKCERCGKKQEKPIPMCICGLHICDDCMDDHYSGY